MSYRHNSVQLVAIGLAFVLGGVCCAAEPSSRALLVYYANETAPVGAEAKNYDRFISWLTRISSPDARHIAQSLSVDREKFQKVVDQEIKTVLQYPIQVLIFDNRLARNGRYLYKDSGSRIQMESFNSFPKINADPVYAANPLSDSLVFEEVLKTVQEVITRSNPASIGMIFKSHGSQDYALTPRLAMACF